MRESVELVRPVVEPVDTEVLMDFIITEIKESNLAHARRFDHAVKQFELL